MQKEVIERLRTNSRSLLWLALGFLAFLYISTAPRTVTFEDAGLFLATSFDWGLPHPPGYPLYTFLVHWLMKISPLTPAFTSSLFSVLCGLGACYFSYLIIKEYTASQLQAALGALLVGLGQTFWNQMVVPEVYALHCLIFSAFWFFGLRTAAEPNSKNIYSMYAIFGLGLANHWPLLILSSPIVLIAVWPVRNILLRQWTKLVPGLLIAFGLYYLMYVRSNSGAQYMFLGPIDSLSDLWGYVNREYYKLADSQAPLKPLEVLKFIGSYIFNQFVLEISPIAIPFFIAGLMHLYKTQKPVVLTLGYGMLSTPVVLALVLHFEFNDLNYNVYRVFHLVSHICFVIFVITGVRIAIKKFKTLTLAGLASIVVLSTVGGLIVNNFRTDSLAEGYARLILDSLPQKAVLFAATDADVGPMSYVNGVLGHRSDVKLMTQTGVFFPDIMFDPFEFGRRARAKATKEFLVRHAPVYSTKKFDILDKEKDLPLSFKYNGIYYLIDSSFSSDAPKIPAMIEAADRLAREQLERKWLFNWPYHRNVVMSRLCNLLVLNGKENHPAFTENRSCRLVFAKHLRATKRFTESSAIVRDIIQNDSFLLVSGEKVDLYNVDLMNQLDWVNIGVNGTNDRLAYVRQAVDFASQALDLYDGCDHPIVEVIKSIQPNPGWLPATTERLRKFEACRKK